MRAFTLSLVSILLATALAGCTQPGPDAPGGAVEASGTIPTVPAQHDQVTCAFPEAAAAGNASGTVARPHVRFETTMGNFTAELYGEEAPITVCNFASLVRSGYYDGTKFHRVMENFMIQGGDPNTKDQPQSTWGRGGPGYTIPDEFHAGLRHNAHGILSMANSGPNSGGSQFFVTTSTPTYLDDRHAVFGRVVSGMEVVYAIGAGPNTGPPNNLATEPVTITKATLVPDASPEPVTRHVGVHPVIANKTTEANRHTSFAVILENHGNVRDNLSLHVEAPSGWGTRVAGPENGLVVRAGSGQVTFATVTPPAGTPNGTYAVTFIARSSDASVPEARASVNVTVGTLGAAVQQGTRVTANYAGVLPDGRLFDTSIQSVAQNPEQPVLGARKTGPFNPFPFTPGSGVIPGFTNLATTAKAGETVTAWIPAADAYANSRDQQGQPHRLAPFDLVFELEIVRIG